MNYKYYNYPNNIITFKFYVVTLSPPILPGIFLPLNTFPGS